MQQIRHPFIANLVESFQDSRFLYLLVELLQGGELFSRIDVDGMPEDDVKFYALCVADALAYLHTLGYVYRGM